MSGPRLTASAAVVAIGVGTLTTGLTLAGCGARAPTRHLPSGDRIRGRHLTVYVSGPLRGPSAVSGKAVVNGAKLALDQIHARVGGYRIVLRALDDVSPGGLAWSAAATTAAAQAAAGNPATVAYVGDLNSGATAVSIPILNRLGIAQVSPYSGAVGLTSSGVGSLPGEPQAYYPTALRTFARVAPSDYVQAQVQVTLQRRLGCTGVYVLSDGEFDGGSASQAFVQVAQFRHLQVVATQSYVSTASSYASVGQTVAGSGADCVLFSAVTGRNAVKLVEQVAAANPAMRLFGTADLAETSFTDPQLGGLRTRFDPRLLITAPTPLAVVRASRLRRGFLSSYVSRYGTPEPAAIDGFAAMRLVLAAIGRATDGGRRPARRLSVVSALFHTHLRSSVLGPFHITRDGDTSLDSYGVYRVVGGALEYWKAMRG